MFLCHPDVAGLASMEDLGIVMKDLCKTDRIKLQQSALSEAMRGMNIMKSDQDKWAAVLLKEDLISAEDKLDTKQCFVRYVSHEIRTPLMVVDIGLHLLQNDLEGVLPLLRDVEVISRKKKLPFLDPDDQLSKSSRNVIRAQSGDVAREDGESQVSIIEASMHTIADCKKSMRVAIDILNDLLAYEKIESGILQLHQTPVCGANLFFKNIVDDEFELQVFSKIKNQIDF